MKSKKNPLDNLTEISRLDKSQMSATIAAFPQQLVQTWEELKDWKAAIDVSEIKNIVTVGMGGSALGAHFINSLFGDELKIPQVIVNDYNLPEFVGKNSLVFVISYSGNTQEPVAASKIALERKAAIIVITTGGKIAEFARKNNLPSWIFNPRYNFCKETRLGLGYLIFGQLLILRSLGSISFSKEDFSRILAVTKDACQKFGIEVKTANNLAKSTASEIFGKIPVVFSSQFLEGNAHIMSNQINEDAKQAAFWLPTPEANHHFLEAVRSALSKENLVFVNLLSEFYDDEIKKRFEIANKLSLQNMIKVIDIKLEAQIPLEECFIMLVLSSWISFYLAILNQIDPTPISTVNYFKEQFTK